VNETDQRNEAFRNFAEARCEEIITNDKECKIINEQLDITERELRKTFSLEQLPLFLKYESLIIHLKSTETSLCYIHGHIEAK